MPLILTPAEVAVLTGETVDTIDLTLAADLIDSVTHRTVDDYVAAGLTESAVSAAWAIVSVRVRKQVRGDSERALGSENESDYGYTIDTALAKAYDADLLNGIPRTLLRIGVGRWTKHDAHYWNQDVLSAWWGDPKGFVQSREVVYPF